MKLVSALAVCFLLVAFPVASNAGYVEVVDVYEYSIGGTIDWDHTYNFSETPPLTATLTIVADDVDGAGGTPPDGEQDYVYINGNYLGLLNQLPGYTNWGYYPGPGNPDQPLTTTVFNIDPGLLDWTMPIEVRVETAWGVEIETSTLEVTGVPEPTSLLLLGISLLGVTVCKFKMK